MKNNIVTNELEGKVAIITGAASGIGRTTAALLYSHGGRIINKLVVDTTLEDWNLILATNVTGAFLHSKEALKAMIPNKSGAIVNIGSYACYFTFPTISAYTASKGALAQLTRTAAVENIEHGIRVNAIGVGDVVTNIIN